MRKLLFVLLAAPVLAQQSTVTAVKDDETFEKKVRPVFAERCYACHGDKVQMGGLQLTSADGLKKAVESGIIIAHDADNSRMMQALSWSGNVKMPPSGRLSSGEIAEIRNWIAGGAPLPASAPTAAAKSQPKAPHWAFQPVTRSELPAVKDNLWARTPIDRFVLAKLEEKNLRPAPAADKLTLLRRVTYDLTGLPPTPDEIQAFLADKSADAFARVVDRLLASPAYGEQWGRHWLDVARYADSTGMDEDNLYPHAWRYRDYVVKAFNDNVPYDRFITEQLAGDLLPAKDAAERARLLVATGYLAIGPRPLAQQDRVQMMYDVVDEQIDSVSKTFLGLTVACARCHDHKFDPIPTKDYYGLASIFASTTSFRNQGRPGSISYMFYEPLDPNAYNRYQAHRWRVLGKQLEMEDALSEDLGRENAALRPKVGDLLAAAWQVEKAGLSVEVSAEKHGTETKNLQRWLKWLRAADEKARTTYLKNWFAATPETIADVARQYQESYSAGAAKWDEQLTRWRTRFAHDGLQDRDVPERPRFDADENPFFSAATFSGGPMDLPDSERVQYLRRELKMLKDATPEAPAMASSVADGAVVDQHVFVRGSHASQGDPVDKHFPTALSGVPQEPVKNGSGRLELAHWLTNPKNPLTARVMVNRIWQWHFGEGLVRTPNNWGTTGERPTHPELLDYLANRFIESGWSVKDMHRFILLSNTWQMSSRVSRETREGDPGNRLWSRFNRVRMSVEQIRDSLLALDGSMDPTMGGTLLEAGKGKRQKIEFDDLKRKTLYVPVRRGSIPTLLSTFDFGDATTPSDGRPRTNVAPQALFLMNSRFVVERSQGLAGKLLAAKDISDADRVTRAYTSVLTRRPDASEIDAALSYIAATEKRMGTSDAQLKAWSSFCHILISSNEFLYLE